MEREARRTTPGPAAAFLQAHSADTFFITFTVAGELACGDFAAQHVVWQRLCANFPVLPWTMEVSWHYGAIFRDLKARGQLIGANDLWIAATALSRDMALVTNNAADFTRVNDLDVRAF